MVVQGRNLHANASLIPPLGKLSASGQLKPSVLHLLSRSCAHWACMPPGPMLCRTTRMRSAGPCAQSSPSPCNQRKPECSSEDLFSQNKTQTLKQKINFYFYVSAINRLKIFNVTPFAGTLKPSKAKNKSNERCVKLLHWKLQNIDVY